MSEFLHAQKARQIAADAQINKKKNYRNSILKMVEEAAGREHTELHLMQYDWSIDEEDKNFFEKLGYKVSLAGTTTIQIPQAHAINFGDPFQLPPWENTGRIVEMPTEYHTISWS